MNYDIRFLTTKYSINKLDIILRIPLIPRTGECLEYEGHEYKIKTVMYTIPVMEPQKFRILIMVEN